MLRSIIAGVLDGAGELEVVEIADGQLAPECDAIVLVDAAAPHEHLQGQVRAVINFDSRTARSWLFRPQSPVVSLEHFSREALLEILRPGVGRNSGWFAPGSWFGFGMVRSGSRRKSEAPSTETALVEVPEPLPPMLSIVPVDVANEDGANEDGANDEGTSEDAAQAAADPVSGELARIAARIADAMPDPAAPAGVPPDLRDLVRSLADETPVRDGPSLTALDRMTTLFALSRDERDLLFMASVVEIDPLAARLIAALNGQVARFRPTPGLAARWGGDVRALVARLAGKGPLLRYGLIALDGDGPLATRTVTANPAVWQLLFGMERSLSFDLMRHAEPPTGDPDLIAPPAEAQALSAAIAQLARQADRRMLVAVTGMEDSGRARIATAIARRCAEARIQIDGPALSDQAALAELEREALIARACIILTSPQRVAEPVWRALNAQFDGLLIIICEPDLLGPLSFTAGRAVTRFDAPSRDNSQRFRLWSAVAPRAWSADDIRTVADRFDFGEKRIGAALANARAQAEAEGRRDVALADAQQACNVLRDTAFKGSAELVAVQYEPDEIVLRPETQRELDMIVAWARHGNRLFRKDGAGASLHAGGGLACLFSGPPGTGKTMAAQIVARQIDYALYRVDLSQVVDKYIGEGEKRLSHLFREASRSRVALFFDEADALFGKRSESRSGHDHYANIAVNHLLQELEGFDGLAILATNFASNIDTAFLRRIRVKAEFPAPDAAERRQIWKRMLPPEILEGSDIDLDWLAREHELVGGEIRNAVYTAHLLAAEDPDATGLAMRHCLAGLAREVGKTGRVIDSPRLRGIG